jgi:hypothetical protein
MRVDKAQRAMRDTATATAIVPAIPFALCTLLNILL